VDAELAADGRDVEDAPAVAGRDHRPRGRLREQELRAEVQVEDPVPVLLGVLLGRMERLAGAAADEFLAATDIADLLVRRGVPFRESHGVVAGLVRHALEQGKRLSELTPDELKRFSDRLDDEYYEVLANGSWLESKVSEGGTASARVREQLDRARAVLEETKA
jgi:argininosuccinate lyase